LLRYVVSYCGTLPEGPTLSSSVQVLWTARYDYQPHWKLQKHKHDYFQMIYFLQGSGRFFLQEHTYNLAKPVLFLIKPNQYHALNAVDHLKTLDIKFQVKDKLLKQTLLRSPSYVLEDDAKISHLFAWIRCAGEQTQSLCRELCGSYLFQRRLLYLRGRSAW